jgi:RHS repeat-associated protein
VLQRPVVAALAQFLSSPRLSPRVVVYGAASVLLTGVVTVTAAATSPSPAPGSSAAAGPVQQRESLLAAQIAARNSGERVEVTGLRTETATTYANPNGTTTTETAAAPIRVRDNAGSWTPVDLHLVASGGHYVPKAAAAGLTLSLGGNDGLAGVTRKGHHLSMKWSGVLPQPSVDGATATYPDVDKNVDLVMQATRLGYGQSFRVKARPDGQLVYRMPLALPGITVTEQPDGGYKLTDASGGLVGVLTRPLMWDAQRDPVTGDPTNSAPLEAKIVASATGTVLQVKPDKAFLDNPKTKFPVTLDPDIHLGIMQDTWVASNTSVGYPTATDLRSGKYSGTGAVQRSFIQFAQLPPQGVIQSATLALYNNQSAGCDSTKQTRVYQVASPGFSSSTYYANRPGTDANAGYVTATGSYAGTGCTAAGWLRWDVSSMVANWNAGAGNYGFEVLAADETDTANWKRYASADNGNNLYVPSLAVTYDNYPYTYDDVDINPSVVTNGVTYTNTVKPLIGVTGCDDDGGTIQDTVEIWNAAGTTMINSATGNWVAACTRTTVGVALGVFQDGGTYKWRARTSDGTLNSPYTAWHSVTVDTSAPPAPSVTATGSGSNGFTFSWVKPAGSDIVAYRYGIDDQNPPSTQITGTSVTLTTTDERHTFHLMAIDRAGNASPVTDLEFNTGATTVTSPRDGARTDRRTTLSATSRTGWADMTFRYRKSSADPWTDIPSSDVTDSNGDPVTFPVPAGNNGSQSPTLTWDVAKTLGNADGAALVQACFHDPGGSTCSTVAPTITVDVKATGDTYATADVGPGALSLVTGNLAVAEADVTDGSGTTSLTVARTFNTRRPTDPGDGMFGPGWLGSFPSLSAQSDYARLTFNGTTAVVTRTDGSVIVFIDTGAGYEPTGDDAGSGLSFAAGAAPGAGQCGDCFTVSDLEGNSTTFTSVAGGGYLPSATSQPGSQKVSYDYDPNNGRLIRAKAQPPVGATCQDPGGASTWTAGCRALEPVYDTLGHVTTIQLVGNDPGNGGAFRVDVSCYAYTAGRLSAQWDPRTAASTTPPACNLSDPANPATTSLITRYDYDTNGRLVTITPPGLAPWTLVYDGDGRIDHIDRTHFVAGTTTPGTDKETTSVEYDLPLGPDTNDASLRPDLRPAAVAGWGQNDRPVTATAVFGPGDTRSRTDLRDADLTYIDADSHPVNTADYANGWHVTTAEYDSAGHLTRELTAANRETALDRNSPAATTLGLGTVDSATAAGWLSTVRIYSGPPEEPGLDLIDSYGPYRQIALPGGGIALGRQHTHIDYDTGNETGHQDEPGPLHLETRRTVAASLSSATTPVNETDIRTTTTEYALSATDNLGWKLRAPMRITDSLGEKTVMRYNTDGLITEKWMPKASVDTAQADAYKTVTVYYNGGTDTGNGCFNPAWAKLPCRVGPAVHAPGAGAPKLPVTTYRYDYLLRPVETVETVETTPGTSLNRTTTTTFDSGGWDTRVKDVTITGGAPGDADVPKITREYDPRTGLPTRTTSAGTADNPAGTVTTGYDDFGRQTSYTDADGNTATSTYNQITGRLESEHNARGTVSYGYREGGERRDLPTSMSVSDLSGTFTATYDSDGNIATEGYPNGLTKTITRDPEQTPVELVDQMQGQTVPWLSQTVKPSVHGQWITDSSTTRARTYGYDGAGRLSTVRDTPAGSNVCTSRAYTYDADSNRLGAWQQSGVAGASCPDIATNSNTGRTQTHTYDPGDRLLATGTDTDLAYDEFGRVKALPATDAGGTAVTNGYWANDLVRSQSGGGRTLSWTLDPNLRPRGINDSQPAAGTSTKTNHYDDNTDSPSWVDESQPPGSGGDASTWTRYVTGLDGNLLLAQTPNGGFSYQLTDLHGDVAATATTSAVSSPEQYLNADEFGNAAGAATSSSNGGRYGWLGGKQRSNETAGNLVLMGARLYAPALGRFLQVDPVPGGSATRYDYASQDPVNSFDIDGRRCFGPAWTCNPYGAVTHKLKQAAKSTAKATGRAAKWAGKQAWSATKWSGSHMYGCVKNLFACEHNITVALAPFMALTSTAIMVFALGAACATVIGCFVAAPLLVPGIGAGLYGTFLLGKVAKNRRSYERFE